MKKTLRLIMFASIAFSLTFTSCKKSDTTTADNTDLATHSDDQARFDNETDAVNNDANAAVENYNAFAGRPASVLTLPCDASSVLDSTATLRRITITYNGTNCAGTRIRTGVVVLTMPLGQHFRDAGAVLTTTFQNLKITRISDNKSITINGVHEVKNVTGGRLYELPSMGTIVHEITSPGMSVLFDNGSTRTWQVGKRRTFTYNNGIVITTIGIHSDGGITGIAEWGTNRFGNAFVTAITEPMVIRQDCNFRLTKGQVTHRRLAADVTVTFGLDAAGLPTTCPAGVYYYKLVWTGANGIVRTFILPY
ncbi:hypothetical protein BH11BAC4_BH11BAC4_14620 [soil metagenome]